jgi:hypothetical protein
MIKNVIAARARNFGAERFHEHEHERRARYVEVLEQ